MLKRERLQDVVREIVGDRSQRAVAIKADLSATTIHDMLLGRIPNKDTLKKFADGLSVSDEQYARLFVAAGYLVDRPDEYRDTTPSEWHEENARAVRKWAKSPEALEDDRFLIAKLAAEEALRQAGLLGEPQPDDQPAPDESKSDYWIRRYQTYTGWAMHLGLTPESPSNAGGWAFETYEQVDAEIEALYDRGRNKHEAELRAIRDRQQ